MKLVNQTYGSWKKTVLAWALQNSIELRSYSMFLWEIFSFPSKRIGPYPKWWNSFQLPSIKPLLPLLTIILYILLFIFSFTSISLFRFLAIFTFVFSHFHFISLLSYPLPRRLQLHAKTFSHLTIPRLLSVPSFSPTYSCIFLLFHFFLLYSGSSLTLTPKFFPSSPSLIDLIYSLQYLFSHR